MTDKLDSLLQLMRDAPPDRDLGMVEPRVWKRIATVEQAMPLAGWRLPALSALAALLVGVASTTTASARPPEVSPFSSGIALAPSTLLESGR
ncbi:hypothetical protein FJQ54_10175 [Sandaracinobacter neustonicus]|uniref:Uncharacterized protein n=1 Tax=Sandaracinobacter neustonicus TaxID=1715348 RepID=A0A501XJ85_9SPHN|nr:hypothetical protein [Sandaracinobacter neustonicus]TPE60712.1 hypothetical protein FJQ54_10175 [Sandaracinobacter neustonicus]